MRIMTSVKEWTMIIVCNDIIPIVTRTQPGQLIRVLSPFKENGDSSSLTFSLSIYPSFFLIYTRERLSKYIPTACDTS
jgi:hypothetical protein